MSPRPEPLVTPYPFFGARLAPMVCDGRCARLVPGKLDLRATWTRAWKRLVRQGLAMAGRDGEG